MPKSAVKPNQTRPNCVLSYLTRHFASVCKLYQFRYLFQTFECIRLDTDVVLGNNVQHLLCLAGRTDQRPMHPDVAKYQLGKGNVNSVWL